MKDARAQTLVVMLCMHRSGSSYTASALHALGMSLGPYPLLGAHASNIHGHFESMPFYELNKRIQEMVFGFADDLPTSEDLMQRFVACRGVWPDGVSIPSQLYDEGRQLLAGLLESGPICGFKDPRTVLTWPFWKQLLNEFGLIRVVPVPLLRSPHEIAMSLCTRSKGFHGYWSSLDLVAVHYARMEAILKSEPHSAHTVRFGSAEFLQDLERAVLACGLEWNAECAAGVFDRDCVHHEPALVHHEAQRVFEALGGDRPAADQIGRMGWLQAIDAAKCETLIRCLAIQGVEAGRLAESLAKESTAHALRAAGLERKWAILREEANRTQATLVEARNVQDHLRGQLAETGAELGRSQERARQLWEECQHLRRQRERLESHPLMGLLLSSRRRVRSMLAGSSSQGDPR